MKSIMWAVLILSIVPAQSRAQEAPVFDVSGGYSLLRDQELEENLHGWTGSFAGYLSSWFGAVGEGGGNYRTFPVGQFDLETGVHAFLAGPRVSFRGAPRVTPFVQLLVGATRFTLAAEGASVSTTELSFQPGGGVDVWLASNVGVRGGADVRRVLGDEGLNQYRVHVGIVLTGGRR